MATKLEVLMGVTEDIQMHGIIKERYYKGVNECCVIGFVLKRLGMDDHDLDKLGSHTTSEIMETVKRSIRLDQQIADKAKWLLESANFTAVELELLQNANDSGRYGSVCRVQEEIDRLIIGDREVEQRAKQVRGTS